MTKDSAPRGPMSSRRVDSLADRSDCRNILASFQAS
uniref:Uncharacterized protein n=1 Tax=Anguilla anguilla TaxID=7936 RepID=A0A0E9XE79_ANGAN